MTIDHAFIGFQSAPRVVDVEKGQLRAFAVATGETDPIYFDEAAAKAAGHRSLPAPPTFAFSLDLLAPPVGPHPLEAMKVPLAQLLHGEQSFEHHKPIYAGDVITLTRRVSDIYEKKGGALTFITVETDALAGEELCVRQRTVYVVRS